jgi:hypothetical protein
MIETIEISLATYIPSRAIRDDEFVSQLNAIERFEVIRNNAPGATCRIIFYTAKYDDDAKLEPDEDPGARANEFGEGIQHALLAIADWLKNQPIPLFEALLQKGAQLILFIDMWIDQDQVDLNVPASTMLQCGQRGIRLHVITND